MFDDALLESRKDRRPGGRRLSLPVAIGLHAAVLGAFVGASAWFTGEAPEPAIPILFPSAAAAPPPPGGGGEPVRTRRMARSDSAARPMQRPVALPTESAPAPSEAPEPPEAGPGEEQPGGGPNSGVDGGTGPPRVGPVGPEGGGEILPVGGDVRAPVLLERVEPDYPEPARRARIQGTVILEAIITTSGAVQEIRVLKPLHPLLDEAAARAVREWRYRPATLGGRFVPVYLTVTVRFSLP